MVYALSKAQDAGVTVAETMEQGGIGRDRARAFLKELVDAGLMEQRLSRSARGRYHTADYCPVRVFSPATDLQGLVSTISHGEYREHPGLARVSPATDFQGPVDRSPATDFQGPVTAVSHDENQEHPGLVRVLPATDFQGPVETPDGASGDPHIIEGLTINPPKPPLEQGGQPPTRARPRDVGFEAIARIMGVGDTKRMTSAVRGQINKRLKGWRADGVTDDMWADVEEVYNASFEASHGRAPSWPRLDQWVCSVLSGQEDRRCSWLAGG